MKVVFGTMPDGRDVVQVRISGHGMDVALLTHGARVQDLRLNGLDHSAVLGWPTLVPYLGEGSYFGAIVGRFANRIGGAQVTIDDQDHPLNANFLDRHLLHGGTDGTGTRLWKIEEQTSDGVVFRDDLPDGHMGFPGHLSVRVAYQIIAGPALTLSITATTDKPTLCSFASHGYWNLDGSATIADHVFAAAADHYLPVNADLIPTGDIADATGRHDWRSPVRIGDRLDAGLIDENLCLNGARASQPRVVASLTGQNGVRLTVETTEPGLQIYAGDHIRPGPIGLNGAAYQRFAGLALEPQIWPDAPHHAHFPSAELRPGQSYRQITTFRFSGLAADR